MLISYRHTVICMKHNGYLPMHAHKHMFERLDGGLYGAFVYSPRTS